MGIQDDIYGNFPQELKDLPQWVVRKGKIPYNPNTGQRAKAGQSETWGTYKETLQALNKGEYDGIGFEFNDNGIVGIDLDHCVNKDTGEIHPEAQNIIDTMASYTEYSPSGTGLHIFVRGDIKQGKKDCKKKKGFEIEMYKIGRYFTVTGNNCGKYQEIADNSEKVTALYDELFSEESKPIKVLNKNNLFDGLKKDKALIDLWNGQRKTSDESSNDMALMNKLAYWCNRNIDLMIDSFHSSPYVKQKDKRHIEKTYRADYLQRTAMEAINTCTSTAELDTDIYKRYQKKEEQKIDEIITYTARELQEMKLPPPTFIVDGLLPCGLSIIVAPPKSFKSWFCLDLCLSVSTGGKILGYKTNQCNTLYFALEDSFNRLQDRINKVLSGAKAPSNFMTAIQCKPIADGFIEQLDELITRQPSIKLIVIDTLQKIKGISNNKASAYENDYDTLGKLKTFADKRNIAILVVHHTRKANGIEGDVFEKILGSTAIAGTCDSMYCISKKNRNEKTAIFSATGRDILPQELVIEFDLASFKWSNKGTIEESEEMERLHNYNDNPIVRTLKHLLSENGEWKGTSKMLYTAIAEHTGKLPAENERALSVELKKIRTQLFFIDKITYIPSNKNNRNHTFRINKE